MEAQGAKGSVRQLAGADGRTDYVNKKTAGLTVCGSTEVAGVGFEPTTSGL